MYLLHVAHALAHPVYNIQQTFDKSHFCMDSLTYVPPQVSPLTSGFPFPFLSVSSTMLPLQPGPNNEVL